MTTEGPNQATAVNEVSDGWPGWSNTSAAITDDGSFATAVVGGESGAHSNWLDYTGFNFSSVPDGADITSIDVVLNAKTSLGTVQLENIQLIVAGSPVGSPVTINQAISASEGDTTLTRDVSAYSTTLSGAQAKASNFGVRIAFMNFGGDDTIFVDALAITLTYAGTTVPGTISDLAATPGAEKLTFTWSAPSDGGSSITKYTLKLSGFAYADNVTSGVEISPLTGGVSSGPWTVTATNGVGESAGSNSVTQTPNAGVPHAIADLHATPGYNSLTFDWSPPANGGSAITTQTLYLNGSQSGLSVTSPWLVTGLSGGAGSGAWTVRATNGVGEGPDSNSVTETPLSPTAPSAISDLAAVPGSSAGELVFTWSAPASNGSDITQYDLYLSGGLIASNVTSPKTVTGLAVNTPSGSWTVKATNGIGTSDPSNAVTETPASPPAAPTSFAASQVHSTSLRLTWNDEASNESNYAIYIRVLPADWGPLTGLDADTEMFDVTDLDPATSYDFYIQANSILGASDPVYLYGVTTPANDAQRKRDHRRMLRG